MGNIITADRLHQVLVELCDTIEEQKEYLSDLDGAIGDGDHGVNMAKCFRGVKVKLQECQTDNVGSVLSTVGMEVMNSVGGAMGALYGTLFIKMAGVAGQKTEIDLYDMKTMFEGALDGILAIGKAQVGRASRLGERTIGHQDAGATSCYFILHAFTKAAA